MAFVPGLHAYMYIAVFAAALGFLIFAISSRGWSSFMGFSLSFIFTLFCLLIAPAVYFEGSLYSGMFSVQMLLVAVLFIDAVGMLYRLLVSAGEGG